MIRKNMQYMVKTTKTFKIKNKNNSHTKAKILLRNLKLHEPKFDSSKNKKIPKYNVYSKYLFQLYLNLSSFAIKFNRNSSKFLCLILSKYL